MIGPKTYLQRDLDKASEEGLKQGKAEGVKQGKLEGTTAERRRILGILQHEEAKDRLEHALSLAESPEMTPQSAAAVLARLPKRTAGMDSQFAAHMASMQQGQEIGPDVEALSDEEETASLWAHVRQRSGA